MPQLTTLHNARVLQDIQNSIKTFMLLVVEIGQLVKLATSRIRVKISLVEKFPFGSIFCSQTHSRMNMEKNEKPETEVG